MRIQIARGENAADVALLVCRENFLMRSRTSLAGKQVPPIIEPSLLDRAALLLLPAGKVQQVLL